MRRPRWWGPTATAGALAITTLLVTASGAASHPAAHPKGSGRHVLLISVDGLHASDLSKWVAAHPSSALAGLSGVGTTYTRATTSKPSDSFPGVLALLTGGTPKSTGVYYDDAYARDLWAPGATSCTPATLGTEAQLAENIDTVDAAGFKRIDAVIDPTLEPVGGPGCKPVAPHTYLRTNTIFNVARDAGLHTAWSDKHPAYDLVNGHKGGGVVDLYTPEVNMDVTTETVNAAGYALNSDGSQSKLKLPEPEQQITDSVANTEAYDQLKVAAVLNEIDGKNSLGTHSAPVPAILGMNFQSVSVGQKLVDPELSCARSKNGPECDPGYVPGGYLPGTLDFTPQLADALAFVDGALGKMVGALRSEGLWDSTEIIITAKHGQSPIDPAKVAKIGDPVSTILGNAGIGTALVTTDDVALVWLSNQSQTTQAVAALNADRTGANTAHIQSVLSGDALAAQFNNPAHDPRTPDLIVLPVPGTIYTTSLKKVAEHGGFAEDDTHVALLVVNGAGPDAQGDDGGQVVTDPVTTTQVAPTVLRYLDLNPNALDAVRMEGTQALPTRGGGL